MSKPAIGSNVAREMFVAGYCRALDDVAKSLSLPTDAAFLAKLRAKATQPVAAVKKATGAQQ